eukprot:7427465-Pyramimonas_sp.AAC.2
MFVLIFLTLPWAGDVRADIPADHHLRVELLPAEALLLRAGGEDHALRHRRHTHLYDDHRPRPRGPVPHGGGC